MGRKRGEAEAVRVAFPKRRRGEEAKSKIVLISLVNGRANWALGTILID